MRSIAAVTFGLLLGTQGVPTASAADALKVGVPMPTSGVFAVIGKEQLNGMQMAIDEAGGSVAGRKIEMLVEDTEAKPDVGLTKARKLILSDGVDIMAGIVSSAVALAVAPYTASRKIPLVISNAATNLLSGAKCDRYVFRVAYSSAQVARPMGTWLAKKGVRNVFIMAADFVAPHEFVAAFKESYLANGGTIAGEVYPPFMRTQDYGPYIAQARAANPGGVFAVFYGGEAILFMKQYQSYGMDKVASVYSSIGLTPQMLHKAQGDAAVGVIASVNYVPELETPENKKFVDAYRKKFGSTPAEFAVMGYDTMRFVIEAVRARNGDTKDKAALVAEMEKVSYTGPRGPMKMDPKNHTATQNVYIAKTVKRGDDIGFEVIETIPNVADPVTGCTFK
jgi:branched-chain amino acid transport system substrate-binding protein